MIETHRKNQIYFQHNAIHTPLGDDIISIHLKVKGCYTLYKAKNTNFSFTYKKGLIRGHAKGRTLGTDPFLYFKGTLEIISCNVLTSKGKIGLVPKYELQEKWENLHERWNLLGNKNWEDLQINPKNKKHKKRGKTNKANWINENFYTDGGKFTLNKKNYVGDYHQHSNGVYMTGATYSKDSEILLISKSSYNNLRRMYKKYQKSKNLTKSYNKTSGRVVL